MSKKTLLTAMSGGLLIIVLLFLSSCKSKTSSKEQQKETGILFENKSKLEPLVTIAPKFKEKGVEAYSIISTTDVHDNFQLSGSADGAGFLKDGKNFIYVVNCEDSYAVARIRFDKYLNVLKGDYLLNSGVADFARQCSGYMWEKEIHGGDKDIFLSASEDYHHDVKAIDPRIEVPTPNADFGLDALGEFHWENAVPLPKDSYPNKTVIVGGDDDSSDSQGQLIMYLSENGNADLENGKVYVLRLQQISNDKGEIIPAEKGKTYNESNIDHKKTYDVEFVEIVDAKSKSKDEVEKECIAVNAMQFMRVEDVDYQKGSASNSRNVFFAVTGRGPDAGTPNDWGAVYRLELDKDNPLKGKLRQIISGNTKGHNKEDGNLPTLQSCDNICVTSNYIYVQEDPNSFSRNHTAFIYQSDLEGKKPEKLLELVVKEELVSNKKNTKAEFGSMIDISDKIGQEGTFLLAIQPHYWTSEKFKNLDGHDHSAVNENNQASQIVLLKGLAR